ncbi:hypothetical protein [Massilia sp. Leaf139]|uniref:hypothetical protein n=1 Tax=Massilia sp. Leaf139 TaxID=1736272 RepID=UPI0006F5707A|nr:hypothetical protein [Massilia sp. Leaf139]KQQ92440.1 hypothetical protein ASF77_22825 [Massilia sp. Leaf139]
MKRIWASPSFAYTLLLLVLAFFGYAAFTAPELAWKLAAGGMAAHSLVCFLDRQHPTADKLSKFLVAAGNGLMCAALIVLIRQ